MTFSEAVSSADVTLQKNGAAMASGDYTVTVSGADVSVIPTGGWEDGVVYTVNVGSVTSTGSSPFEGTAFTVTGSNNLFTEDFEGYPIGVIATGSVNTVSTTRNPGGLVYKLAEGDTLEVVEKDGSKVLKLTAAKGNTAERRVLLDFDRHYGEGKAYDVSFDYYVENNSVWFNDFGTVYDDKISGHPEYVHTAYYAAIKPVSSYRDDLYFDRNTKTYYGGALMDSSDEFWKHQNTMIDFSENPMPFIIKTTKTSDGSKLAKRSMTVSQTYGKQTADNISSIAWGFKTNDSSNWNGQDEGSGVYYIDNITVRNADTEAETETEGIYVNNAAFSETDTDNVYDLSATLSNNTETAQSYQPIIALFSKTDHRYVGFKMGESGVLEANSSCDISIPEINADLSNVECELLIWEDLTNIKPIVDRKTVTDVKIGKTVVFAENTKVVLVDGEPVEDETGVAKGENGFVIPAATASKYFDIDSDLTAEDIAARGIGVYVSEDYDFIAVGDDVSFSASTEQAAIKKFGIYVSTDGSDDNAGYCSAPVQTLAKAVSIYKKGDYKQPIIVHGGTYRLNEAVYINGSKCENMTIKAFGDGDAVVSGAVELPSSAFTAVTDSTVRAKIPSAARSYVKQISLADYVDGDMSGYREYAPQQISDAYYELFAGNEAQTIARYPNSGFSTTSGVSGKSFTVPSAKASLWKSADNGIIAGYFTYNWAFEDIYINKTSGGSSTITLNSTPKYGLANGQRYYAMNMLEELDSPGEYYIDNSAKILYYYPTGSFNSVNPELSIMDKSTINLSDTSTLEKNCLMYIYNANGVKISGITFEKTRGSGIVTNKGSGISIDGCTFGNIGRTAVEIASSDSEVINSHIYSIGGRGIDADAGSNNSLTDGNIRIADNTIHNFGRIFRTYQGAIHLSGCGNIAEYNTIYDAPHCAIRFNGSNHKIRHNLIHDVVKETSDSGAIYAGRNWTSWGTAISSNYFYNIKNNVGDDYTNQAVYMDDLLCGTTVSNNVIKDSDCAALFGGGRGNTFKNNTVVNCNVGLKYDNRGETYSASQLQLGQTSSGENTILQDFVDFLANDSVIATMTERDKFNGFTKLVEDVNSSSDKLGYPKHATITGNSFYGSKVNNSDYLSLAAHVTSWSLAYRDNNTSTSVPAYDIPECGARN